MAIKLVDNWRSWPRMFSQWCNTAGIAGLASYQLLPDSLKSRLTPDMLLWVSVFLFILGFIGRLLKQESVSGPDNIQK